MSFDYFYGQQSDLFTFYRVPKVLFDHSHELTPKEKEIWMLFDRVDVAELLARDAFAKGAYMLGAEDREIMLK